MERQQQQQQQPCGAVLGVSGGVRVRSCWGCPEGVASAWRGEFCGRKWQCVELARRYLIVTRGATFASVPRACDIFGLRSARRLSDGAALGLTATANGGRARPVAGRSLLVWAPQGPFAPTGHVAVVVRVHARHLDVIEQNAQNATWAPGAGCSRRLAARTGPDGGYRVECSYQGARILGWTTLPLLRSGQDPSARA
jgi:glutathionylspermidine amidase/synthetase